MVRLGESARVLTALSQLSQGSRAVVDEKNDGSWACFNGFRGGGIGCPTLRFCRITKAYLLLFILKYR